MTKNEKLAVENNTRYFTAADDINTIVNEIRNDNYRSFSFDGNSFNEQECTRISEIIQNHKKNISGLEFNNVTFDGNTNSGIESILWFPLRQDTSNKIELKINYNNITEMRNKAIGAIRQLVEKNYLSSLSLNGTKPSYNLSWDNTITAIAKNTSLTKLELNLPELELETQRKLFTQLANHSTITQASLHLQQSLYPGSFNDICNLLKSNKLTSLTLEHADFLNEHAYELAHIISRSTSLEHIDARFIFLGENEKKALLSASKYNSSLEVSVRIGDGESQTIEDLYNNIAVAPAETVTLEDIIENLSEYNNAMPANNASNKFLNSIIIDNLNKLVGNGAALEEAIDKIEDILYHNRNILENNQNTYKELSNLCSQNGKQDQADVFAKKAIYWSFVQQIKQLNNSQEAENPCYKSIISQTFENINLTKEILSNMDNILTILHLNPKIVKSLQAEHVATFFTAQGFHTEALAYYPSNNGEHYTITIHNQAFSEFLTSENNGENHSFTLELLGGDAPCNNDAAIEF